MTASFDLIIVNIFVRKSSVAIQEVCVLKGRE